ncbi:hypothetical protein WJX74_009679 [Apatococcus lobatus]|uniref:MaoC-like domain-containing protein n=1 Tax=Apatococcus lobatus TaxID=904363 RepID=A0AAW1SGH5_9CHLO
MLRLGPLLHCSCEASLASLQRMQRNHVSKPESAEQEPVEGCSDSSRLVWSDKRLFTAEIIQDFCRATGDFNPIHLDPDRAKRSGFPGTIVPGIFVASMFPAIIAAAFPGAVYLSQSLKFRHPAVVPAEIQATVTLVKTSRGFMRFTTCASQGPRTIVDGAAMAKMPPNNSP